MADGSIRVVTRLDNTALKQQIKEFERELNGIQKEKAKTESAISKTNDKYKEEREIDSQFPAEFSHREDIDKRAAQELDTLIAKQDELNQKEQIYIQKIEAANAKLAEQSGIADASKQVDREVRAESSVANVTTQAEYNSLLEQTRAKMAAIESAAARVAYQTGLSKDKILAANPAYQKLRDTMGVLTSKTAEFGSKAKKAGKDASKGMKQAKKETNGFSSAISKGIKKVGMMGLAVFGIRSAYRAVRMATMEYMSANAQLAGTMETLKVGFAQLLGPAIEYVVNLLVRAISAVNEFVHALSGINFVAKMNSAALNKQAKATSGAAKASNQLAGFDEQTKLSDTSGGGGSSSPIELLDATVGELSGFSKKLKDQILAGDWFGAGKSVGDALMDGIESIDWLNVGTKIGEVLWGAVAFVFGLAVSIDAETILAAANQLLIGLFNALSAGLQSLDWYQIGRDLLDLLLLAIAAFNPGGLIIALMLAPGGEEMTRSASEFIGSLIGALAAALAGLASKIGELASSLWNGIKTYFDSYVDWDDTPGNIIKGLFNGIVDAIKGIGNWIYNNIWVPFRDGFKAAFGIHSPSTRMKEFGGYMMDGLRNGIVGCITKVTQACQVIWNAIKNVFANVGSWFKNIFTEAWTGVKNVFSAGGEIFVGIKDGIVSAFKTIVNALITGINKVVSLPFSGLNKILDKIHGISIAGMKPFSWLTWRAPIPEIPQLARGGIVNNPGKGVHAIIGEAGKEAVLPLENNTEWMDILAEKIGGNVTIPIILDGKKIATYVVDIQKKKAFAMNGA